MKTPFFRTADHLYIKEIKRLQKTAPELFTETHRAHFIKSFIKKYGENNQQKINYSKDYLPFNQAFLLKNLYKCFITISFLKTIIKFRKYHFVDIGSGAGTFTIAATALFNDKKVNSKLIDNCPEQLQYSKKLIRASNIELMNGFFPDEFVETEGIRLGSYWLCEQTDSCILDKENQIKREIIGDCAIFIDYPDVIGKFLTRIGSSFEFIKWSLMFDIPTRTKQYIHESNIKIHGAMVYKKQGNRK